MTIRKPPWWWKDKRPRQAEKIKQFQVGRARAARANKPDAAQDPTALDIDKVRYYMQLAELRAIEARVPRPKFNFEPGDVTAVHHGKIDDGPGLWFRLKNGRVIRDTGEPDTSDFAAYLDE